MSARLTGEVMSVVAIVMLFVAIGGNLLPLPPNNELAADFAALSISFRVCLARVTLVRKGPAGRDPSTLDDVGPTFLPFRCCVVMKVFGTQTAVEHGHWFG